MKPIWIVVLALALIAPVASRAQALDDALGALKQQMQDMQQQMQKMQQKINELEAAKTNAPPATAPAAVTPEQMQELNQKVDQVVEAQKKVLPSEFNPAIGLVGETVFSYRSRGSDATGSDRPGGWDVNQRSVELNIAAAVDPFAKGYVVANASADAATGEATFGIEEAALQTTALPWNLELKAGRFFGEFGKLEYIHDHELPFVNRPLALAQYIGGESRSDGLQVNWLLPVDHYVSLTLGVGDSFGGDSPNPNNVGGFRGIDGFNFWGRLSTYFDLTPDWQAEMGVSGLINPHTHDRGGVDGLTGVGGVPATERERRLAGVDFQLRYIPLRNNQFNSFTWGTELLYSDNRYLFDPDGIPGTGDEFDRDVDALGLYSYMTYKFSRQWSAGFLFDYVQNAANEHDITFAYSPYVTWALSHWNQLRLQYTHTDHNAESGLKDDDAVYLQWAWIIGAHSHGWQQR
jgi:Sec-independent protein translocase protein TatA